MPGFGLAIVAMFALAAFCVALAPLLVVLCIRGLRKRPIAWAIASLPLCGLLGLIFSIMLSSAQEAQFAAACEKGQVAQVRGMLENGSDPNSLDEDGFYAIELAVHQGHWDVVKLLVDQGAVDQDTGEDDSPRDRVSVLMEEKGHAGLARQLRSNTKKAAAAEDAQQNL
jgi:hypothetical protein